MTNFNTLSYEIKRKFNFLLSSFNSLLSKTDSRLLVDMLFGISCSQSVLVSEIARGLHEDINIKYTYKRLSRHLHSFTNRAALEYVYYKRILSLIDEDSIIVIDDSEITKEGGSHFEYIGRVKDGVSGDICDGYHKCEVVVLVGKAQLPVKLYSPIYSEKEPGFKSTTDETQKALDFCFMLLNDKRSISMDRGYDNEKWMKLIVQSKNEFVIRMKRNRNVIYKGKTMTIMELADTKKGNVRFDTKIKGKKVSLYCSHAKIHLPSCKQEEMELVIVYGYGKEPMMLLTNHKINNKKDMLSVLKKYILRWKVEEKFRFEKVCFSIEDIRVNNLQAINLMNKLLDFCILLYAEMLVKKGDTKLTMTCLRKANPLKKKTKFLYYQISRGIKEILSRDTKGMKTWYRIGERKKMKQLSLKLNI